MDDGIVMPAPEPQCGSDLTQLLIDWNQGAPEALNAVVSRVFEYLRRIAGSLMRGEREEHTLQPTELVHELFLRLQCQRKTAWENRVQFFAFASQVMRKLLVDHSRRHLAAKRGGGTPKEALDMHSEVPRELDMDLVRLDDALRDLARLDPRQSLIVELRFFVGLSVEEVQEVLGCSRATVIRDWRTAKLWLLSYMRDDSQGLA